MTQKSMAHHLVGHFDRGSIELRIDLVFSISSHSDLTLKVIEKLSILLTLDMVVVNLFGKITDRLDWLIF